MKAENNSEVKSHSQVDLEKAKILAGEIVADFESRQIVLLSGGLGAGKTQWVQFFLEAMGCEKSPSPTYPVIHQVAGGEKPVYHVDLYRLETADEVESVGFWDIFETDAATVFVEWPERIRLKDLPMDWGQVRLEIQIGSDPSVRDIQISFG